MERALSGGLTAHCAGYRTLAASAHIAKVAHWFAACRELRDSAFVSLPQYSRWRTYPYGSNLFFRPETSHCPLGHSI